MGEGATWELTASGAKIAAQTALMLNRSTGRPASQLCPLVTTKIALYSSSRVKEAVMDRVSTILELKKPGLGRRTQYAPDGSCG